MKVAQGESVFRGYAAGAVVIAVAVSMLGPSASALEGISAQDPDPSIPAGTEGSSTTTPTTVAGETTTTLDPSSTLPSTTTSTTIPVDSDLPTVTIPPELVGDPRAPILLDPGDGDGGEIPADQALFGLFQQAANQVLLTKVAEYQAEVETRKRVLSELQTKLIEQQIVVDELAEDLRGLDARSRKVVSEAAKAEEELRDHTIEAFINGSSGDRLSLVRFDDPVQLGIARELLGSVVKADEDVISKYRATQAKLESGQAETASALAEAGQKLTDLQTLFDGEFSSTASAAQALQAYESGAQIYVKGFVFPVAGATEFIDSWGYPRMTGTAVEHWHQGTDIFAEYGTPIVAAESGVLFKVGQASLGGNKLWVRGDSGTEYYNAHLSAFADGVKDGKRVNAGDVIGFVGDTGNARGTPPHLHFEVHVLDNPVNPYPLLKATYGSLPMVEIVAAPEVDPSGATGFGNIGAVLGEETPG